MDVDDFHLGDWNSLGLHPVIKLEFIVMLSTHVPCRKQKCLEYIV